MKSLILQYNLSGCTYLLRDRFYSIVSLYIHTWRDWSCSTVSVYLLRDRIYSIVSVYTYSYMKSDLAVQSLYIYLLRDRFYSIVSVYINTWRDWSCSTVSVYLLIDRIYSIVSVYKYMKSLILQYSLCVCIY